MIARVWRGWTAAADADAYLAYVLETGVAAYRSIPGNNGAYVLRRTLGDRTEFVVFSLWASWEAIRAFAGDALDDAVFYAADDAYLIEREIQVMHYDVGFGDISLPGPEFAP